VAGKGLKAAGFSIGCAWLARAANKELMSEALVRLKMKVPRGNRVEGAKAGRLKGEDRRRAIRQRSGADGVFPRANIKDGSTIVTDFK
jgi:hypothetical protein